MVELASQFLGINHPEATLPLTQRLLQLGSKTAQVYYLDGSAQASLGNVQAAINDLENASNLEPTNLSVLGMLTQLYLRTGRGTDAERVAARAVTFNKTDPQAYTTLGAVYASEHKWDDARKEFQQAYSLNPKDQTPLMQIAQTWVLQNSVPNALAVINRAIQADPKNVQALLFRGDLYAKQNDLTRASEAYDDAAAAAPNDGEKATIMVHKAQVYAGAHQPSQAQAIYEQAIRQYPLISSLHTAYGEYWLSSKQSGRAEQQFQAALQGDRNDPSALLDMAQLKLSQARMTDAIGYLKRLTEAAPSAQSFALLGQAYVASHDYGAAKDACAKSFEIARSPDTLGCVAGSDYNLKNYKEAAQIFDVLNRDVRPYLDRNPQMLYMAGASYAHTNQKSKALDAYRRLLSKIKPGTKAYRDIQAQIAALTKSTKTKHS